MAKRQIARGVSDAIARDADVRRAERLTEAAAERLDSLDELEGIGDRPAEEIVREICRDVGVDPLRMGPAEGGRSTMEPLGERAMAAEALGGGAEVVRGRGGASPAGRRGSG